MSEQSTDTRTVPSAADTAIRSLIAERVAAYRARDARTLLSRYAPEVVRYDLAPPLGNRGPQTEASLAAWFDTFDGPIEYEVRDLEVIASGDLAYSHSLNRLTATPKGAPADFTLWFRATLCLRASAGTWSISHEHTSTPFHMDGSMRAATDLRP